MFGFLGLWLTGCAQVTPPPYNPLKLSREEFFAKTKVLAFLPLVITVNVDAPDIKRAQFEAALERNLTAVGLKVIPSTVYQEIWDRLAKQMGGVFDPISGKRDDAKIKTLRDYTLNELRTKHDADGLLHPSIQVVKASFFAANAQWHGASESVIGDGFLNKFLVGDAIGTTSALSLLILIENMNGVDLYQQAGGIQVVAKLAPGRQFVGIPQNQILADEERNLAAVEIALRGLSKDALVADSAASSAQ